ncbi:MAG: TrmH family RNA methyltransferase [Oligoflexales bacterium]
MITSFSNEKIKNVVKLRKRSARSKSNTFVVEGAREISQAIDHGYKATSCFYGESLSSQAQAALEKILALKTVPSYPVSKLVFPKLAVRENSDGLVVLFETKSARLSDIQDLRLVVVVESIEKPGNLGALLRSCDGAGVGGILILNNYDVYNPNVIRSSLGSVFSLPIVQVTKDELKRFLGDNKITMIGLTPEVDDSYFEVKFDKNCAVLLGEEAAGMTESAKELCDKLVKIPMQGAMDSLNLSVAGSVVVFEALRQRLVRR